MLTKYFLYCNFDNRLMEVKDMINCFKHNKLKFKHLLETHCILNCTNLNSTNSFNNNI